MQGGLEELLRRYLVPRGPVSRGSPFSATLISRGSNFATLEPLIIAWVISLFSLVIQLDCAVGSGLVEELRLACEPRTGDRGTVRGRIVISGGGAALVGDALPRRPFGSRFVWLRPQRVVLSNPFSNLRYGVLAAPGSQHLIFAFQGLRRTRFRPI